MPNIEERLDLMANQSLLTPAEGDDLLVEVLGPRAATEPLRETAARFLNRFTGSRLGMACGALALLLRDDLAGLLGDPQRIASWFILSVAHCGNVSPGTSVLHRSPFYPSLAKIVLGQGGATTAERAAVHRILVSGFLPEVQALSPVCLLRDALGHWAALERLGRARLEQSVSLEPDADAREWRDIGRGDAAAAERPGVLPPEAIQSSLEGPLLPSRQKELADLIRGQPHSRPDFPRDACGYDPLCLPLLVENNPAVAAQLLLKVFSAGPHLRGLAGEYLEELVAMGVSLPAMEVLKTLICEGRVPRDVTNMYIAKCIASCQSTRVSLLHFQAILPHGTWPADSISPTSLPRSCPAAGQPRAEPPGAAA